MNPRVEGRLQRLRSGGVLVALLVLSVVPLRAAANDDKDPLPEVRPPDGIRVRPQKPEKELKQITRDIDRRKIEATIQKLVSFGTRHTESSQTDPNQGIGAAINYVFQTLSGYAARSGGRMTVELQTYHQPPVPSTILNPNGVDITNVVATLKGSKTPEPDLRGVRTPRLTSDRRHQSRRSLARCG